LGLGFDKQNDEIGHIEQPVRDACGHRLGRAQCPVDLDEVLGEVVDRDGGHVGLNRPAEAV
jgi:hypothetical protein